MTDEQLVSLVVSDSRETLCIDYHFISLQMSTIFRSHDEAVRIRSEIKLRKERVKNKGLRYTCT